MALTQPTFRRGDHHHATLHLVKMMATMLLATTVSTSAAFMLPATSLLHDHATLLSAVSSQGDDQVVNALALTAFAGVLTHGTCTHTQPERRKALKNVTNMLRSMRHHFLPHAGVAAYQATIPMTGSRVSPSAFDLKPFPTYDSATDEGDVCYPLTLEEQCESCELNDLFSEYYGQPIWLCAN